MPRFTLASFAVLLFACGHAAPDDALENVLPTASAPAPVSVEETPTDPGVATSAPASADAGAPNADAAARADGASDGAVGAQCTELETQCCPMVVSCTGEIAACHRVAAAKDEAACGTLLARYQNVGCDHEIDVPAPAYPPPSTFHGCPYKGNHGGAIP